MAEEERSRAQMKHDGTERDPRNEGMWTARAQAVTTESGESRKPGDEDLNLVDYSELTAVLKWWTPLRASGF